MSEQRVPVLLDEADVVARKLRANPGRWFLIAAGDRGRMRSMLTTAWKIRRGKLVAFRTDECGGYYKVATLTSPSRANKTADVEIKAMWCAGG